MRLAFNTAAIRAISFDVTGTLLFHRLPIAQTYAEAAVWAQLRDPPTRQELTPAFKAAYKTACLQRPCFGHGESGGERGWWSYTVKLALENAGKNVSEEEFERYFGRIYQFYGSPGSYQALPDVQATLDALNQRDFVLGITSNTPGRTTDTVLPMLNLHHSFKFFANAYEIGAEKPDPRIFQAALDRASFWCGQDLQPNNVLHVGDNLQCDFIGARSFGFQALHLDRSANPAVIPYNDWVEGGDYPGKSEDDIRRATITNLSEILAYIDKKTQW